jgi:hypothetical protein
MEIECRGISDASVSLGKMVIECREVRHDLLIAQIIQEKGISFVLQAIGNEKAIAEFMQSNGYTVFESSWKAA